MNGYITYICWCQTYIKFRSGNLKGRAKLDAGNDLKKDKGALGRK